MMTDEETAAVMKDEIQQIARQEDAKAWAAIKRRNAVKRVSWQALILWPAQAAFFAGIGGFVTLIYLRGF